MKLAMIVLVSVLLPCVAFAESANLADVIVDSWEGSDSGLARTVLDSFPSPDVSPMGVEWVELGRGGLYHVDESVGNVYSITPEGVATWLFDIPTATGYAAASGNGICYVEEASVPYLYIADYNGFDTVDRIYKFTPTGTFVAEWDVDAFIGQALGITFDGVYFWVASLERGEIIKCNSAFVEVAAYPHPGGSAGGIDYDPVSGLFYVMTYPGGMVYICDDTMTVQDSFMSQGTAGAMLGICVGRIRGRTLWCASFNTEYIYEILDELVSPVEETTWGSIKALFR